MKFHVIDKVCTDQRFQTRLGSEALLSPNRSTDRTVWSSVCHESLSSLGVSADADMLLALGTRFRCFFDAKIFVGLCFGSFRPIAFPMRREMAGVCAFGRLRKKRAVDVRKSYTDSEVKSPNGH